MTEHVPPSVRFLWTRVVSIDSSKVIDGNAENHKQHGGESKQSSQNK